MSDPATKVSAKPVGANSTPHLAVRPGSDAADEAKLNGWHNIGNDSWRSAAKW